MPSFDARDRVQPAAHTLAEEVDGEVVILDLRRDVYFGLQGVANEVWPRLKDHDVGSITEWLIQQYPDTDSTTLRSDLERFLSDGLDAGVLVLDDS